MLRLSVFPSVAVDAHGVVNLAWEEHQGSRSDIFVRQLPSGVEGGLTGFPAKLSQAIQPSIALDDQGVPTVAFVDDRSGPSQVFVGRLAPNGHWQEEALESNAASSASVRVDAKHRTVVSWKEDGGTVRVARWNGARWQRLGDNVAVPREELAWPSLGLVNSSQPLVAFRAGSTIQLRQWAANEWVTVASHEWLNPPERTLPSHRMLAFDVRDVKACVVWLDEGFWASVHVACDLVLLRKDK